MANDMLEDLRRDLEKTQAKVDKLVRWKDRVVGGAAAVGLVSVALFGFDKGWEYLALKMSAAQIEQVSKVGSSKLVSEGLRKR